jgi:hypothetical protein
MTPDAVNKALIESETLHIPSDWNVTALRMVRYSTDTKNFISNEIVAYFGEKNGSNFDEFEAICD